MFKNNKTEPTKVPRTMPVLRADGSSEPSQPTHYAPRNRRFSEEAAIARQHVIDMEDGLQAVTAQRDEERINREVAERDNARLKDELVRQADHYEGRIRSLSADRDYHRDRHVEIDTRLNAVAEMLVSAAEKRPEPTPPPPKDHAVIGADDKSLEDDIANMILGQQSPR